MSVIDQLYERSRWEAFLHYKQEQGHLSLRDEADLARFIAEEEYIGTLDRIRESGFSVPAKRFINKVDSGKKRVVYIFGREENYVLKLMTFLLIRKYDAIFAANLFSFRSRQGVRRAVKFLKRMPGLDTKYVYKSDISDYFNSIDVSRLLPILEKVMSDDMETFGVIARLLSDDRVVLSDGSISREKKGIMAGVPLASFLANVYLKDMDWHFRKLRIPYARYSDDIILFASTAQEREQGVRYIHDFLQEARLEMNAAKECFTEPFQKWTFLGISYEKGVFDVSEISARKLKMKMRRKSRALLRWKAKKHLGNDKAARAFVKAFNRKLYDNDARSELTWARWFFPIINTADTLEQIDHYMQDCIRYIASGKRNRARYRFRYEDMKRLGYRSLVHEYYAVKKNPAL